MNNSFSMIISNLYESSGRSSSVIVGWNRLFPRIFLGVWAVLECVHYEFLTNVKKVTEINFFKFPYLKAQLPNELL